MFLLAGLNNVYLTKDMINDPVYKKYMPIYF